MQAHLEIQVGYNQESALHVRAEELVILLEPIGIWYTC